MDIWGILGIEYTDDISAIKKAYANKLRIYHPEENADGYQRLREAYDHAVKNAKNIRLINEARDNSADNSDEHDIFQSVSIPLELNSSENYHADRELNNLNLQGTSAYNSITFESRLEKLTEQLDSIYLDFLSRLSINAWVDILNHDIMWEMDRKQQLFACMVEFFSTHRFLPKEIWVLLNDTFQLQDQLEEPIFREFYSLRNFLIRIFNQRSMSFEFLFNIEYEGRERYIEYRIHALDCLQRKDYALAGSYIEDAKDIFDGDPELTCLEGRYLLVSDKKDEAIKAFSKVLEIIPNSEEALRGRANVYLRKEDFNSAKNDFEALILLKPNDTELIVNLAKIYKKLKDPINARNSLKKINAYELNQNESYILELEETNKELIKISKMSCNKKDVYLQKELPFIKAELKKLQKYKRQLKKSRSDGIYKGYFKFIFGLVLVLLVLFIANIFYKSNVNRETAENGNSIKQKENVSIDGNGIFIITDSDGKPNMLVRDFSELDLDKLSKTGEKILAILSDIQILNFCIDNSSEDNAETLIPLPSSVVINENSEVFLNYNNKIYIGKIGNNLFFIRGNIYSLTTKYRYHSSNINISPSKIIVEGRIIKNNITEFKSQIMNDVSSIEWYGTNPDFVNTDYIFKMDDYLNSEN